jgi:hypothetical protein
MFTHVRMTIFPGASGSVDYFEVAAVSLTGAACNDLADGGVKRLRVFGRRTGEETVAPRAGEMGSTLPTSVALLASSLKSSVIGSARGGVPALVAEPLTTAGFAPYGDVIQAFPSPDLAPAGAKCTSANNGSAWKYHRLSTPEASYPADSGAVAAVSCFRAVPPEGFGGKGWKGTFQSRMFERHAFTTRASGSGKLGRLSLEGTDFLARVIKRPSSRWARATASWRMAARACSSSSRRMARVSRPRLVTIGATADSAPPFKTTRPTRRPSRPSSHRPRKASPTRRASGTTRSSLCASLTPCSPPVIDLTINRLDLAQASRPTLPASRRRSRRTATARRTARSGARPTASLRTSRSS